MKKNILINYVLEIVPCVESIIVDVNTGFVAEIVKNFIVQIAVHKVCRNVGWKNVNVSHVVANSSGIGIVSIAI